MKIPLWTINNQHRYCKDCKNGGYVEDDRPWNAYGTSYAIWHPCPMCTNGFHRGTNYPGVESGKHYWDVVRVEGVSWGGGLTLRRVA